ncbi:MAG: gluconokinase [Methylobacteriaceae bacterium]|jgi:carbohydrate kinase (thermoresistant glucokinase family)|nr:gluconokinase [Methylobacteriaceae bacterium]
MSRDAPRPLEGALKNVAALVVMGVSGSGKTTIAALLAQELGWRFEDGDWFHPKANVEKMESGTPLTDADRQPWLEAIATWIDDLSAKGAHGVVACSALKRRYRDVLARAGHETVRFIYLKGDKALIAKRMTARHGHFMPPALLESQFATLEEPAPDEHPITVSVAGTPGEIVADILAALRSTAHADQPR